MKNNLMLTFFCLLFSFLVFSQDEPILIAGNTQGTTYHITYYDKKNRNLQPKIEKLLHRFDLSVSTYIPNSIISRINSNQKNIKVDTYFITCFNKAKEVWKNTNGAFDPTVYSLVNAWGFGPGKKQNASPAIPGLCCRGASCGRRLSQRATVFAG